MKLTASKKDLIRVLERVSPIADKRSTMPMLANAHLSVSGSELTASATDLYLSAIAKCPVTDSTDGAVCMAPRDLLDRIKAMPGDVVTLTEAGTGVTITGQRGVSRKFTQHCLPGDDFPAIGAAKKVNASLTMKASDVLAAINGSAHTICADDTRLALNSLLLEHDGDCISSVATDGHRLARRLVFGSKGSLQQALIPLKGVTVLRRELDGLGDAEVSLAVDGSMLLVSTPDGALSIKLTDSQLPPWEQVVPEKSEHQAIVDKSTLIDALKSVTLASGRDSKGKEIGGVRLTFSKNQVTLSASGAESGDGSDLVECECKLSKDVEFGICARYLIEAIAALPESSKAIIGFGSNDDPITVSAHDSAETNDGIQVVMPMRV